MKARELSGEHMGKRVAVNNIGVIAVAGQLIAVTHRDGIDIVSLQFLGLHTTVNVPRDIEVELLDQ